MQDDGNKAAHKPPLADCVDSVLEVTLMMTQGALLSYFTHGKKPDFKTVTA
jgi:hypothetical protein